VDQSGAMISEDVAAKGYALLCVAQPTSDCKFQTIPEVRAPGAVAGSATMAVRLLLVMFACPLFLVRCGRRRRILT